MPVRYFEYARKVLWAGPQGREKVSRLLRIGILYLFRLLRAPRLLTSEQPSAYFGVAACYFYPVSTSFLFEYATDCALE